MDGMAATAAVIARRNLVLIGNPRSNQVLRGLEQDGPPLPLSWDARSVRGRVAGRPRVQGSAAPGRRTA